MKKMQLFHNYLHYNESIQAYLFLKIPCHKPVSQVALVANKLSQQNELKAVQPYFFVVSKSFKFSSCNVFWIIPKYISSLQSESLYFKSYAVQRLPILFHIFLKHTALVRRICQTTEQTTHHQMARSSAKCRFNLEVSDYQTDISDSSQQLTLELTFLVFLGFADVNLISF